MQRDRYGFVYIWYDRKHKRFYIGCHWGYEDDGYICSSRWMRKAYRRRPEDFGKRRILSRIYTSRKDLLEEEYRWLLMIKDEELKIRYYNLSKKHFGHWVIDENKLLTVGEKISKKLKLKFENDEEFRRRHSEIRIGKSTGRSPMKGKHHTEEAKQKTSKALKGRKNGPLSEEHKQKMSLARKGQKPWNTGLSKLEDERVMNQASSLIGHPNYNETGINQYSGLTFEMQERPPQCKTYIIIYVDGRIETVERLSLYSKNNNIPKRTLEVGIQKGYGPKKYNIMSIINGD